jgi:CDP-diglyceride synthetase
MHPFLLCQLLFLLMLANGTPIIAKKIFDNRYSYPLDGNLRFVDHRPLFGRSKTIRGVALAVVVTTAGGQLIGLGWKIGLVVGGFAMLGDLFSSFLKRRFGLLPSSRASGLDQIPESLLALLACRDLLGLTTPDIVVAVIIFYLGEVLLSRVLYTFRVRDRPY